MIEQSITYLTAILLGVMLFFSFVVAPSTFRFLNEEYARKFIRGIFPLYYLLNLSISLIVVLLIAYLSDFSLKFYLMLSICILFFISNFFLMPLINKFKDNADGLMQFLRTETYKLSPDQSKNYDEGFDFDA